MERATSSSPYALPLDRVALGLVVWAAVVATTAPGATWLDSSELAAAGVSLGVPHAPGHPLYVILAHLASWLPFGPTMFRVALLSGLCTAAVAWLTADLVDDIAAHTLGERPHRGVGAVAALALVASGAVWQQAVRAEVYTLHLALILWATRDAIRWWAWPSARTPGNLAKVAFTMGLAAANHHFLTLLHLPALLILLCSAPRDGGSGWRSRVPRAVAWATPAVLLYAILPLRALTDPLLNYGDPRTLSRFLDVVSAQTFQVSLTSATPPLLENLALAASMLSDTIGAPVLVLAALGLALVARRSPALGAAVALALAGNLASKVSMVLDPTNPDALGYFQTTLALGSVLAGVSLAHATSHRNSIVRFTGVAVAGLALLWTGTATALSHDAIDHSDARTTALTDMALLRRVPPGAVWMTSNTFLHFNRLAQHAATGYRPDVITVHQGFERHVESGLPLRDALVRRDGSLTRLADAAVAADLFPTSAVLALARERPVYLEPTFGLPLPLERLAYDGGYMRVLNRRRTRGEDEAAQRLDEAQMRVSAGSAIAKRREARTVHAILWLQLAVVRIQQGEGGAAGSALTHVDALVPGNPYTARLHPIVAGLTGDATTRRRAMRHINAMDFRSLFD